MKSLRPRFVSHTDWGNRVIIPTRVNRAGDGDVNASMNVNARIRDPHDEAEVLISL